MIEEWRWVPGYEGRYEISEYGRVRNVKTGVIRKPKVTTHSHHLYVVLEGKYHAIHRTVARAFIGESDLPVVRHLDDNRENNHWSNLAWGTQHDNVMDAVRNGVHQQARKTHCPRGHEYTPENTIRKKHRPRSRVCRSCDNAYQRRRHAANQQKENE